MAFQYVGAADAFYSNFDASLNGSYSVGDNAAYFDSQPAELTSPGVDGSGSAANVSFGQSLKYRLANNLDTSVGDIEMDFKMPYNFNGTDNSVGKLYYNRGIYYDVASDFVYTADYYNHRIVRTKMDGTGWTVLGSVGSGKGQFYYPTSIYYDSVEDFVYVADRSNNRIVKTKMDGTGWATFGVGGSSGIGKFSSPSTFDYDSTTGFFYIADTSNYRIVKTKFDGTGWTVLGSSALDNPYRANAYGINYDRQNDFIYYTDYSLHRIIKTKIDGTGWTTYGSEGAGIGNFSYPTDIYYNSLDGSVFVADYSNHRIVKTQMDGTGWTTYGSNGSGVGKFSYPCTLKFDSSTGFLYIADYGNSRIVKTQMGGTGWATYGTAGWGDGMFYAAGSIAYDKASDYIFIADTYNHRIVKTKIDGTGWTTFGTQGNGVNQFLYPQSISYDSTTDLLYIVDRGNSRIVKTKMDGTGWTTYGSSGTGIGRFNNPYDIQYDQASEFVYVADYSNHRIVKTKMDGTGWTTYGSYGTGVGQFKGVMGINYDNTSGYIYATDYSNHRIVKTKMDGTGWTTYGSYGSGIGQFYYPSGIQFDKATGDIYIADNSNARIVKTKIDGSDWTTFGTSSVPFLAPGRLSTARDVVYDETSGDMYIVDYQGSGRIIKSKWDLSDWTPFDGSQKRTLFTTSGSNPMTVELVPNRNQIRFTISAGATPYVLHTPSLSLNAGDWHKIKVSYNNSSGEVKILIDGNEIANKTFAPWSNLTNLGYYFYVGSNPIMPSYSINQPIDNFRLYTNHSDTVPPENPSSVVVSNDSQDLISGNWYNDSQLSFSWLPSNDIDSEGNLVCQDVVVDGQIVGSECSRSNNMSGVDGYLIYFGTDQSGDPLFANNYTATTSFVYNGTLVNDQTYYFRLRTRDLARNYSEAVTLFEYKYDNNAPNKIEYVNIDKPGCQIAKTFTLTWPESSDTQEGQPKPVVGYDYKLGAQGEISFTEQTTATITPYQDGDNVFYVRSKDQVGNVSDWQTLVFCTTDAASILTGPTVKGEPTSLEVSWVSSKQTTSYVKLDDGTQQGKNELTQVHVVSLIGLEPQRQYKYKLVWKDASNNDGESEWFSTTTMQARVIKNPTVTATSPFTATIDFEISDLATVTLKYGVGNYEMIKTVNGQATKFSERLVNLTPGTNYQLIIEARSSDNQPYYTSLTFTTLPYPKISGIEFDYLKEVQAAVRTVWETNLDTTSIVRYRIKGSEEWQIKSDAELKKAHDLVLNDLEDNINYEIQIEGMDGSGNKCTSDVQDYSTPFDTRAPKITNFSHEVKSGTSENTKSELVVSWETDEPSSSQVEYSDGISGADYNYKTKEDNELVKSHIVVITGLDPSRIYHLRAVSEDASDNIVYGDDTTIITNSPQQSVVSIIVNSLQKTFGWMFGFLK